MGFFQDLITNPIGTLSDTATKVAQNPAGAADDFWKTGGGDAAKAAAIAAAIYYGGPAAMQYFGSAGAGAGAGAGLDPALSISVRNTSMNRRNSGSTWAQAAPGDNAPTSAIRPKHSSCRLFCKPVDFIG